MKCSLGTKFGGKIDQKYINLLSKYLLGLVWNENTDENVRNGLSFTPKMLTGTHEKKFEKKGPKKPGNAYWDKL